MARSWKAIGRLEWLWQQLPVTEEWGNRRRDYLAALTDMDPTVLSQYNSAKANRPLSMAKAKQIIDGAAKVGIEVTPEDLGRPPGWDDDEQTLGARLTDLAAKLGDSMEAQAKMAREIGRLRGRVRKLEAQRVADAAAPSSPRKRASQ